jgi:hypothetical protein
MEKNISKRWSDHRRELFEDGSVAQGQEQFQAALLDGS